MNDQRERPEWLPADEPELLLVPARRTPGPSRAQLIELARSEIRPTRETGPGRAPLATPRVRR